MDDTNAGEIGHASCYLVYLVGEGREIHLSELAKFYIRILNISIQASELKVKKFQVEKEYDLCKNTYIS